ncbi:hypothetical protein [Flavobacterium sedimenticola]|uniref:Uncharacterized protein n=1 Tax=Flavobacterium sedimenticola TaxID=3043286 RepID=A0ABT6XQ89_9FLAO|nr:hypothetical protein [Flavobacterium sedimenticola]MDI9257258.1 hypothetical protein [Flavobacterium sedimenticola]
METQRNWKRVHPNTYFFWVGDKKIGELELHYAQSKNKAMANIEGQLYVIERKGFWKNRLEITNSKGETVLKGYPLKWFSDTMELNYQNTKLNLKVRNNPLAEYAITDATGDRIAYGVKAQNGAVYTQISTSENQADYLLDFLLWYLFHPVAQDNSGDSQVFYTLLMAQ